MPTWSNLANNRYISTNNILQGVISGSISLFTGNTLTFSNQSNQWIDKLTFSNSVPHGTLSTTFNNKLDNQWITKTDIIPGMECPCNYSITYSTVINNYNCYNLTNAMSPLTFLQIDKVQNGYWCDAYYARLYSGLDGIGQTGSDIFTGLPVTYTNFANGSTSTLNYQLWNNTDAYRNVFGYQGLTTVNYSGRMNYCGNYEPMSHNVIEK